MQKRNSIHLHTHILSKRLWGILVRAKYDHKKKPKLIAFLQRIAHNLKNKSHRKNTNKQKEKLCQTISVFVVALIREENTENTKKKNAIIMAVHNSLMCVMCICGFQYITANKKIMNHPTQIRNPLSASRTTTSHVRQSNPYFHKFYSK